MEESGNSRVVVTTAPRAKVRVERNSKGYVWEVELSCESALEALEVVRKTEAELCRLYGGEKV